MFHVVGPRRSVFQDQTVLSPTNAVSAPFFAMMHGSDSEDSNITKCGDTDDSPNAPTEGETDEEAVTNALKLAKEKMETQEPEKSETHAPQKNETADQPDSSAGQASRSEKEQLERIKKAKRLREKKRKRTRKIERKEAAAKAAATAAVEVARPKQPKKQ